MSPRRVIRPILAIVLLAGLVLGALRVRTRFKQMSARLFAAERAPAMYRVETPYDVAEVVLDGKLGNGWQDWGWGPRETPGVGLAVGFESYGGIILRHDVLPSRFGALVFRYRAPPGYDTFLDASLRAGQLDEKLLPRVQINTDSIAKLADGWSEALIPWEKLNPSGVPFDRVVLQARRQV